MRHILFFFAALCLTTPALAEIPTVKPGQDFIGIGYELTSSGKVEVYAAPRQVGDKLAICGLVFVEKATNTTKALEGRFSEKIGFHLAGKSVRVQTGLFKRYYSKDDMASALAGCSVTQKPWDPAYAKGNFTMSLGNETVRY